MMHWNLTPILYIPTDEEIHIDGRDLQNMVAIMFLFILTFISVIL